MMARRKSGSIRLVPIPSKERSGLYKSDLLYDTMVLTCLLDGVALPVSKIKNFFNIFFFQCLLVRWCFLLLSKH